MENNRVIAVANDPVDATLKSKERKRKDCVNKRFRSFTNDQRSIQNRRMVCLSRLLGRYSFQLKSGKAPPTSQLAFKRTWKFNVATFPSDSRKGEKKATTKKRNYTSKKISSSILLRVDNTYSPSFQLRNESESGYSVEINRSIVSLAVCSHFYVRSWRTEVFLIWKSIGNSLYCCLRLLFNYY